MKLLTLNTHSLIEANYPQKLTDFVAAVAEEMPDIIALQEVNQRADEAVVDAASLLHYTACDANTIIRADNHVLSAVKMLADRGVRYYWTWLPVKNGYGIFDEGLALMSLSRISAVDALTVSVTDDYLNWKRRKILGIRTQNAPDEWFFSVHYGWWGDQDEHFESQWQATATHMARYGKVWLMGDFNNPADLRSEGYDLVSDGGWFDSYALAERRDNGITVEQVIDGWRERTGDRTGMRIDQIWVNRPAEVKSSRVIFNGLNYPVVSDHYGVMIEYERSLLP